MHGHLNVKFTLSVATSCQLLSHECDNCDSTPVAPCAEIICSLMPQALFFLSLDSPCGPRPPHCWGFATTLRHTRFGRTPLGEWSTRRQDVYLKTHNTHKSVVCFQVEIVIRTCNPIKRHLLLDCAATLNCYNNNTVIPWRMYNVYCLLSTVHQILAYFVSLTDYQINFPFVLC